uniref:Tudor domain-containing protein n=1 Tax=Anopheles maculatus TaxID=74869 RepID=A0A182SQP9_9DIPT
MVAGKALMLKVTPPEGAAFVSYCELYENGENLFLRLQKLCREQIYKYPPPGSLQRGASYRVVIRYIESCAKFFVSRLDNVAVFDEMMDELIVHCQGSASVVPGVVNVGDVYAVSLDPNDFYRAEVVETEPKIKVRLIDYGNVITTQRAQLKRLSPTFVLQRPEAFECCLEGFEGSTSGELSTSQLEMLAEGADGDRNPFKLIVCDVRDGKTIVNLLDESQTPVLNVAKKLLKLNTPIKLQQNSSQQKQSNKRLSGGNFPANGGTATDQLGTSVDSVKAPLSSSGISSGQGDCIDLTNDEWSGGPPLPGNQSTGYDLQTGGNGGQTPPARNNRNGGGGNGAGYGRGDSNNSSRDSSTSNSKQDTKRSAANNAGATSGTTAGGRNDIPRFNKDRAQMPYYYEHDDRCTEPYSPPGNAGFDGNEAKRNERNKKEIVRDLVSNAPTESNVQSSDEFMPYRSTFLEQTVTLHTRQEVVLSWWYSPEQFYVRLRSDEDKYHDMMKQLQKYYRNKSNQQLHQQQLQHQQSDGRTAKPPATGSIVVVRHPKHNTFYRARVLKYNESVQKYKVELVDSGNKLALAANDLWMVERRFTRLAPMAIACALPDVRLRCEVKELQGRIDSYLSSERQFEVVFLERAEGKYHCKVDSLGRDLKEQLLADALIAQVYVDIDLTRLKGQTLKVQLVEMKSLNDFRVKLLGHEAIFGCRQDGCDVSA